ncbi:MAG TPA: hypothetical protein VF164_02730 [Trueperaceae bacterium]
MDGRPNTKTRIAMRLALVLALALTMAACGQSNQPPGDDGKDGDGDDGPKPPQGDPQAVHDTIAYVAAGGDEIRLIDPDGSDDRRLWAHGQDDPEGVYDVWTMAWNPQSTRLAFASTHENWCSLFGSDIFSIGADGTQYERITQAPSCAELADFPQGTVRVPVKNYSFDSFTGFMYYQGAASLQMVTLPPNGTGMVTFTDVADFGSGEDWLQVASLIVASNREVMFSSLADVQAGGTVTTSEVSVYEPAGFWEAHSPSWRRDGTAVSFIYNFNSFTELPAHPEPLTFGTNLMAETADFPLFVDLVARGPTSETANDILYAGTESFESTAIYLVSDGSSGPGEPLVEYDSTESILGLAWLPDGSGFVYSVTEGDFFGEERSANLFLFDFQTGMPERITDFVGEFAGLLSVSPDGTAVVFERADAQVEFSDELLEPDLWVVRGDGSLELLVEEARAPAWSW